MELNNNAPLIQIKGNKNNEYDISIGWESPTKAKYSSGNENKVFNSSAL